MGCSKRTVPKPVVELEERIVGKFECRFGSDQSTEITFFQGEGDHVGCRVAWGHEPTPEDIAFLKENLIPFYVGQLGYCGVKESLDGTAEQVRRFVEDGSYRPPGYPVS